MSGSAESATILVTERLLLRRFGRDDLGELLAMQDPALTRFVGRHDAAELRAWMRECGNEWDARGHGRLAVVERAGGRFVGRGGLKHLAEFDELELGWSLRADARGCGYATEASAALLAWGFQRLDAPHITAMINPDNAPSIAVAERLGMTPLREDTFQGEDLVVYAITREASALFSG